MYWFLYNRDLPSVKSKNPPASPASKGNMHEKKHVPFSLCYLQLRQQPPYGIEFRRGFQNPPGGCARHPGKMRKAVLLFSGKKNTWQNPRNLLVPIFFGMKKTLLIKPIFKSVQKITGFLWYRMVNEVGSCDNWKRWHPTGCQLELLLLFTGCQDDQLFHMFGETQPKWKIWISQLGSFPQVRVKRKIYETTR